MNKKIFSDLISKLFNSTKVFLNNKKTFYHNKKIIYLNKSILKNIPFSKQKYISILLDNLSDEYLDYCNYTNKEYYKAGFIDCLNLILPALFKNFNL